MIVVCPSCATHHDVPQSHLDLDGAMIRCAVCGNSWIESRAISVIDAVALQERMTAKSERVEQELIAEREVARLAQAARAAEAKFAAARVRKRKERRGWVMLAASVALPALLVMMMPQEVARAFPPARMSRSNGEPGP